MIKKFISGESNIKKFINKIVNPNTKINVKIEKEIDKILERVKKNGDNALIYFANKFDKCNIRDQQVCKTVP